jgi:penicillin-binding protein 1A
MEAEANNASASAATPVATPAVSWRTRLFKPLLYAGALVVAGTLTTAFWWWSCGWNGCPTSAQLRAWTPTEGGALLARDSALVSALSPVNRTNVPLSRVPAHVQAAFIAVEDRRFHAHHGVDWYGVARATLANITAGSVREGASTITMQLARNVFLGNRATERTLGRKLLEWRYATLLEGSLSKQDILERYLNAIYLGNGVYGVEGASRDLFDKSVKDLSLSEAALLAGLPKAPSSYSPRRDKARALTRRAIVFDVLLREGVADSATIRTLRNKPLELARAEWAPPRAVDSWAVEAVRVTLDSLRQAGVIPKALNDAQLRVWSTIDRRAQVAAERVIAAGAWQIDQERAYGGFPVGRAGARTQGALVALDPTSGALRALVGGRRVERKGFNRALRAKRQPGSTFKPFVYAEALRQGFTAATMLEDEPVEIDVGRTIWMPSNYGDEYAGHITMRDALARSANAATVRLSSKLSMQRIADLAHAQGIVSDLPIVPALALGAGAVTPLELTAAYAPFGNGGRRVQPYLVERVEDQFGRVIWSHPRVTGTAVLAAADAFLITSFLQDVVDRGTGRPVREAGIRGPVAGKTGTTNDGADVWFVGYTPTLVASVWFGADDPQPLGWNASGGRLAAPVWARFLRDGWHSPEEDRAWIPPAGLETKQIDIGTGKLASDWCGPSRREYFVRGSAPEASCENDPYLAMRDAEPPAWNAVDSSGSGAFDPAQIAEAVSGMLEAMGGNTKARAATARIISELRKAQRQATRDMKREDERD